MLNCNDINDDHDIFLQIGPSSSTNSHGNNNDTRLLYQYYDDQSENPIRLVAMEEVLGMRRSFLDSVRRRGAPGRRLPLLRRHIHLHGRTTTRHIPANLRILSPQILTSPTSPMMVNYGRHEEHEDIVGGEEYRNDLPQNGCQDKTLGAKKASTTLLLQIISTALAIIDDDNEEDDSKS